MADHHEHNFKTAATGVGKAIETLKDSLKVIEQHGKGATALSKPKQELTTIKEKLTKVIKTLGELKNEAKSEDGMFYNVICESSKFVDDLTKALEVALKVEDKDMDIESRRRQL
ncbi:hypothetical protein DdX_19511 [Ditylenchus destructor]|uniref:Uncharacterized protein n=1 Tax=Ditylenchus destructor TaxID=166010 RepID=A0AAD4MIQ2_9BILA|nr:hypothetical protein DdX_19511 [Ditylenchus destructor]